MNQLKTKIRHQLKNVQQYKADIEIFVHPDASWSSSRQLDVARLIDGGRDFQSQQVLIV